MTWKIIRKLGCKETMTEKDPTSPFLGSCPICPFVPFVPLLLWVSLGSVYIFFLLLLQNLHIGVSKLWQIQIHQHSSSISEGYANHHFRLTFFLSYFFMRKWRRPTRLRLIDVKWFKNDFQEQMLGAHACKTWISSDSHFTTYSSFPNE